MSKTILYVEQGNGNLFHACDLLNKLELADHVLSVTYTGTNLWQAVLRVTEAKYQAIQKERNR